MMDRFCSSHNFDTRPEMNIYRGEAMTSVYACRRCPAVRVVVKAPETGTFGECEEKREIVVDGANLG